MDFWLLTWHHDLRHDGFCTLWLLDRRTVSRGSLEEQPSLSFLCHSQEPCLWACVQDWAEIGCLLLPDELKPVWNPFIDACVYIGPENYLHTCIGFSRHNTISGESKRFRYSRQWVEDAVMMFWYGFVSRVTADWDKVDFRCWSVTSSARLTTRVACSTHGWCQHAYTTWSQVSKRYSAQIQETISEVG